MVYNRLTAQPGLKSMWRLSRFQISVTIGYLLDPSSEEVLLHIAKKHDERVRTQDFYFFIFFQPSQLLHPALSPKRFRY